MPQTRSILRNRVTEKDLRTFLNENDYYGDLAQFEYLELFAIERPGWVQIYKFEVTVKHHDGDKRHLFGVCRDDERDHLRVELLTTPQEQAVVAVRWSKDLITRDRQPVHIVQWILLALFALLMSLALAGSIFNS